MLNTPTDMRRKPWIPCLNCKEDCDLGTKMVVHIFTHTKNPQCLYPPSVALLHRDPKLIDVNELALGHLKIPRGEGQLKKLQTRNWMSSLQA